MAFYFGIIFKKLSYLIFHPGDKVSFYPFMTLYVKIIVIFSAMVQKDIFRTEILLIRNTMQIDSVLKGKHIYKNKRERLELVIFNSETRFTFMCMLKYIVNS